MIRGPLSFVSRNSNQFVVNGSPWFAFCSKQKGVRRVKDGFCEGMLGEDSRIKHIFISFGISGTNLDND